MDNIFNTSLSFADLGLSEPLLKGIEKLGFERPTQIQADMIPAALEGRDILGESKTGTGKTAAFGLPMLQRMGDRSPLGALILCPVRELAIQVAHELRNIARYTNLKVVPIYGGQSMGIQAPKLQKEPDVIVGTPGRVMDFHRRGLLPYDKLKCAILDEVDRMLDIGFREDIRRILGSMRQEHQTILVSATISNEIERLSGKYLKDPLRLHVTAASLTVEQVEQNHFSVERWDKGRLLVHLLRHEEPAMTLVFCRTKLTVDALTNYLKRKGIEAHAIHGDLHQGRRNKVMSKLRGGELSVLVASDIAARGLDVDDITHVINFDLPEDPEIYVHRIGRTARVGRDGMAWSFVTPDDGFLLTNIEKLTNVEIKAAEYADFTPGPVPTEVVDRRRQEKERRELVMTEHSRITKEPPPPDEAKDELKFPGGVIPKEMPRKRMGGRLRSGRRR